MIFNIPYNDRNKSGIYAILNLKNCKVYVGSAVHLHNRYYFHNYDLEKGIHCNDKLTKAIRKHGSENFSFILLALCDQNSLIEREQFWIDRLNAVKNGYNILELAGNSLGFKHSEETKAIFKIKHKGRKQRPESIALRVQTIAAKRASMTYRHAIKINQHDGNGNVIRTFSSLTECGNFFGFGKSAVSRWFRGHNKKAELFRLTTENTNYTKEKTHTYVCKTCGTEFQTYQINRKFCSLKCREFTLEQKDKLRENMKKATAVKLKALAK